MKRWLLGVAFPLAFLGGFLVACGEPNPGTLYLVTGEVVQCEELGFSDSFWDNIPVEFQCDGVTYTRTAVLWYEGGGW